MSRRRRRSWTTVVGAAVLAVGLASCGTPSPDLFVVGRSGTIPGAKLGLLITDGGFARCNGGPPQPIGEERLLMARKLAKDLDKPARDGVALPPGPRSVLTFRVEVENGTVRFSDTSRAITPAMRRMQSFTRDVAKRVCGLAR